MRGSKYYRWEYRALILPDILSLAIVLFLKPVFE